MSILSRNAAHWTILVCALIGAVCPGFLAVWLLVEAAAGHGSNAGNILRVGFGVLFLLISVIIGTLGAIYWKSFRARSGARSEEHSSLQYR